MSRIMYRVKAVTNEEEARKVSDFFFSEHSFDDTNHTPGERQHFLYKPYEALEGNYQVRFVEDEGHNIIGVNSYVENEQLTRGYFWDYIAVHRQHRNKGIGGSFVREMMTYMKKMEARYMITYTCSLDQYAPIRHVFERLGFRLVGRWPDYYFEGEDRLVYHLKL